MEGLQNLEVFVLRNILPVSCKWLPVILFIKLNHYSVYCIQENICPGFYFCLFRPCCQCMAKLRLGETRLKPVYGRIIDMSKPFTCVDGRKQDGAKITLHTTHKTDIIFLTFYKPNKNSNYKSIRQKWDLMGGGILTWKLYIFEGDTY